MFPIAHQWQDPNLQFHYSYADYNVPIKSDWPLLPRHVVSLPQAEAFSSSKVGRLVARAHSFIRAQMPFLVRLSSNPQTMFSDIGYDAFRAFFDSPDLFPLPATLLHPDVMHWASDQCFTDQFLHGCNPTVIERVSSIEHLDQSMPVELRTVCDPSGRSVEQLVTENALLIADYAVLATPGLYERMDEQHGSFVNSVNFEVIHDKTQMDKHFYAPFVAFYQTPSGKLGVLGIVLTRFDDRVNAVYNARTCEKCPNIYTFAKMHVACADNNLHQFYSHLGRCHLAFEPFGVAVRNVFQFGDECAKAHIVGKLLNPHFKDHMAINWLARNTLISNEPGSIPFTDAGFSLGAQGGLGVLMAEYRKWKFSDQAFPTQLRKRGFAVNGESDGLTYHYRSDGICIWNALYRYVFDTLTEFYNGDDNLIANDAVLKKWCLEMRQRERAAVQSFPEKFESVEELAQAMTTIIYMTSAEHSAVNFSQERYLSYVPNRPNALFKPVPVPTTDKDMKLVGEVLALKRGSGDDNDVGASMPMGFAFFQVSFAQILTEKASHPLMELDVAEVPAEIRRRLKTDLMEIHEKITARNEALSRTDPLQAPYEYLDPMTIAQSIEI